MEQALLFLVVVLAVGVVALFVMRNSEAARARAAEQRISEVERARVSAESNSKNRKESLEGRTGEIAELREKLRDAKRKLHDEKEVARKHDIEHAVAQAERDAQSAIEAARRDAAEAQQEVKKLKAELDMTRKVKRPETRPEAAPAPAAVHADGAPAPQPKPEVQENRPPRELTEVEQNRIALLERQAVKQADKVKLQEEELKKLSKRADTNNRIYLVAKSELDANRAKTTAIERRMNRTLLELDKLRQAAFKAGLVNEMVAAKADAEKESGESPAPAEGVAPPPVVAAPAPAAAEAKA